MKLVISGVVLFCAGCSASVSMFPIEGPVAAQRPLPELVATADGITGGSGGISLTLADGQTCRGKWASVAPQFASVSTVSLFGQYASVAGFGMSSGIVPGINRGEAFLSCSRGTTIQAEFFTGSGTANGHGIAKDSDGNVYKMLF